MQVSAEDKGSEMEFRPCIDIHDGKVKQIVGGSLQDEVKKALQENFVSGEDAAFYARLYKKLGIRGGHIILLNSLESECYAQTKEQALLALAAYPGGMQVGGGITPDNAQEYLDAGASHVIVTSYVFRDGRIDYGRLEKMRDCVGSKRLVLDLSCKKTPSGYMVVTDRWQKVTTEVVNEKLLDKLADYCEEFLIHAVDVEGKALGIEEELAALLGRWGKKPVTYAGGVHDFEDLALLKSLGRDRVNVTIGSALDIFGGKMSFEKVVRLADWKK